MRKIAAVFLLFVCSLARAQSIDSTGYYTQMNNLFSLVDKKPITTGFLRDYSIEFNNWDNYTGAVLHDSNFVCLTDWRMLYAGLYTARIINPALLGLDSINRLLNKYTAASSYLKYNLFLL